MLMPPGGPGKMLYGLACATHLSSGQGRGTAPVRRDQTYTNIASKDVGSAQGQGKWGGPNLVGFINLPG